jgi:hypothetical protein
VWIAMFDSPLAIPMPGRPRHDWRALADFLAEFM